jgi:hypothetical protein
MKTHFSNRAIPPVTPQQLKAVGVDPESLWFSPTFRAWTFCGELARQRPYATTGQLLSELGLEVNPNA